MYIGHPYSPATYLASGMHNITSSVQRVGSSSRPVQRRSDIDFDRIPSPRRDSFISSLSSSRSKGQAANTSRTSNLSRSVIPEEAELDQEPLEYSPPPEDFDTTNPPRTPTPEEESDLERTPRAGQRPSSVHSRASYLQVNDEQDDQDDQGVEQQEVEEEEEDEVEAHMTAKSSKVKGKSRQSEVVVDEDQDVDIEGEIAQGLDEVDKMPEEQFDQEEEEQPATQTARVRQRGDDNSLDKDPRPNKKARKENGGENQGQKKPRGRPRKEATVLREGINLIICATFNH